MSIERNTEVWIHPARYSGKPCVGGRRTPVESLVVEAWLTSVDSAAEAFDVSRQTVLVACWYAGLYGTVDPFRRARADRTWIRRWRGWADQWGGAMWAGRWDKIPDPPTESQTR